MQIKVKKFFIFVRNFINLVKNSKVMGSISLAIIVIGLAFLGIFCVVFIGVLYILYLVQKNWKKSHEDLIKEPNWR